MSTAALYLPAPTGPYPVGTTSVHLTDTSRPDPWAAGAAARELMVSLWYPAASSGGPRAQYMTPAESELQLTSRGITGVPPDALSTVRANATVGATPAGRPRSLPLVVLSPGFTNSRSTLTALAEDHASHGYVVAGIDHTYESFATAFPDGRVTTCLARAARRRDEGYGEKLAAGRAADVSFVLGELTDAHPAWPGAGLIDPSRMAMAGHSAGGAAAIAAMLADSRIRAGIDMDGATVAPIPEAGLSRPFLFLGKQSNYTPGSGGAVTPGTRNWKLLRGSVVTWERDWKLLTGWKRWLLVAGAVHASFTDLALLADQVGLDIGADTPGARSLDITRAYVRAFSTSTCAARRKPCWTSRQHATPRSRSAPRETETRATARARLRELGLLVVRRLGERCHDRRDRRAVQVSLTAVGRTLVSQAASRFEADVTALLSRLPPRDRETLTRLVSRLLTAHAADQGIDLFASAAPGSNHPK